MKRLVLALGATIGVVVMVMATVPANRVAEAQSPTIQIGRTQKARFIPSVESKRPISILAIGSDARPGVCMPVPRCLADSLHLITVNPDEGAATILGFPRDSYVTIPGVGQAKINEGLFNGGPDLMVETVEELTGIPIDYYLLTSFDGLSKMVNAVGGIEVDVPYDMNDSASGAVFPAGPRRLTGKETLAFSRNRKNTPNGDFSRSENQGLVLMGALEELQADVKKDAASLFTWLVAGIQHTQTDLSFGELFDLGLTALSIDPGKVQNLVVPGGIGSAGAASIVVIQPQAKEIYRDMADDGMVGSG